MKFSAAIEKVEALVSPRNVVIVGATDRAGSWASLIWRNLKAYGFKNPVYLVNPKRDELFGEPCYKDVASLPEPPDHLTLFIPPPAVAPALEAGALAGARSATIYADGFERDGGVHLAALRAAIARTGLGVSGPNCNGTLCAKSRLVTLADVRPLSVASGPVAIVGQSGGVMMFMNRVLEERGIHSGYIIASGNETGLTTADYIAFFAADPEVRVIVSYIESIADIDAFRDAAEAARKAGKHIVAIKAGRSKAGRDAALAHTGALAGAAEVFDAVAGDAGVVRADTPDEAVEMVELLLHTGPVGGRRIGALTLSGAFRGFLLDAAERSGLVFPPLAEATQERLRSLLGMHGPVTLPVDGGFAIVTSEETYLGCIEALRADPDIDLLLLQEELPRAPGSARAEAYIRAVHESVAAGPGKPVVFVSLLSASHTPHSRAFRAQVPRVSFLSEAEKALGTIAKIVRREERLGFRGDIPPSPSGAGASALPDGPVLNEVASKRLLEGFGIVFPKERVVSSLADAEEAARAIGFPVVLKIVAADIAHKSDVGGVALDLKTPEALAQAYRRIEAELLRRGLSDRLEGMLVSPYLEGGVEMALGLHRDPEMGLVLMAGAGGTMIEFLADAQFAALPMTPDKARDLIARTRISRLLKGFRGAAPADLEAVVSAIMGLAGMAAAHGERIETVDINPLLVLPEGRGAVAVDALVVLRPQTPRPSQGE